MADDEKKPAYQILQALDALSQTLHKARANRRTTSLTLPRSAKDGDDVVDAAKEEARPRRRLSPTSPLDKKEDDDEDDEEEEEEEDDDDSASDKSQQGFAAVTPEDAAAADGEKNGITSWGPIRVLLHISTHRSGCVSSMEVVAAQGLPPPSMNGLRLAVNVRKEETRDGGADFDEALCVRCSLGGGGAAGKPLPLLLSAAIDAPELDCGRSTVDMSQFSMEFTGKWDMVFPLAAEKAKGGNLVLKLAFQSIDDIGGAEMYGLPAGKDKTAALSSFARKLSVSSISNMLNSMVTHTRTPKLGVPAPDLEDIDSFMLVEHEQWRTHQ